jgi:peptide-methionine (S)-S-oxide reductase
MKTLRIVLTMTSLLTIAGLAMGGTARAEERVATFGGGCFWCMEPPYDTLDGVISTTSGYMGGSVNNPTYRQVVAGGTGHVEVVQVRYDAEVIDYEELLRVFWRNIDPLTDNRQFCDAGESYRPVIFAHGAEQRALAEASKAELVESGRFDEPIIVPVEDASSFWPAEGYHQDYYEKNPVRYKYYRWRCGRDQRLEALWGDEAGG